MEKNSSTTVHTCAFLHVCEKVSPRLLQLVLVALEVRDGLVVGLHGKETSAQFITL
jgi:hypothetical protein